jgi:VanZ family protein
MMTLNRLARARFSFPPTPAILRWLIAISYVVVLTITLVQPSRTPLIGPAAPPGPPDAAREAFLTAMHILGFSLLVVILWWAFRAVTTPRRALWIALAFVLVFSPVTELVQTVVPGRSASWWDWCTNTVCTMIAAWMIGRYIRSLRS